MSTFIDTTSFGRGEIAPDFVDRVDAEFRGAAVGYMRNWQPDLAGPVEKRPLTWGTAKQLTGLPFAGASDVIELQFRDQTFLLYVAYYAGSNPRLEITGYGPVQTIETVGDDGVTYRRYGLPLVSEFTYQIPIPATTKPVNQLFDYVRIGPAVFFVSEFFPPQRVYVDGSDLQVQQVQFFEEVIGIVTPDEQRLWQGVGSVFKSQLSVGLVFKFEGKNYEVAEVLDDNDFKTVTQFQGAYRSGKMQIPIDVSLLFAAGYPKHVTVYQGRLVLAGSNDSPTRVWVSAPNDVFLMGANAVADDSPINVELLADGLDEIQWCVGSDRLYLGGTFGEFSIGEPDGAITPGNFGLRKIGTTGSSGVPPALSGSRIYYVNRTRGQIWAVQFSFDTQSFVQTDLAALAPHLVADGIRAIAVQPATNADRMERLYVVTDKHELRTCTIDIASNVLAWARADLGGQDVGMVSEGVNSPYIALFNNGTGWTAQEDDTAAPRQLPIAMDLAQLFTSPAGIFSGRPSAVSVETGTFLAGQVLAVYSTALGYLGLFPTTGSGNRFVDLIGVAATFAELGQVIVGLPIEAEMVLLPGNYTDQRRGSLLNRPRRLIRAIASVGDTRELVLGNFTVLTAPPQLSELYLTGRSGNYETRFLGWSQEDKLRVLAPDYSPATIRSITREYSA